MGNFTFDVKKAKGTSDSTQSDHIERKVNDQVRVVRIVMSGTHEDMMAIYKNGKLGEWCQDSIRYLYDTFGIDNVVSAHLNDDLIRKLCAFKEISVAGKLYSTMFNQSFSTDGAVCSLKEDKEGRFDLRIDGVSHHSWFRRKKDEFMEALGLPTSKRQNRELKL